jgi:hypothetical protein
VRQRHAAQRFCDDPGAEFASAAKLLAGRGDVCFGLHITLNSEWDRVKWGPVLPVQEVPSLVDENGHFWPTPSVLHDRGFNADEAMAEIEAQLTRAREAGLHFSYIDEHMGVSWVGGLRERIRDLAQREGLLDVHSMSGLPPVQAAHVDLLHRWTLQLENAAPGTYVLVTHPGRNAEDMRQMYMKGVEPVLLRGNVMPSVRPCAIPNSSKCAVKTMCIGAL